MVSGRLTHIDGGRDRTSERYIACFPVLISEPISGGEWVFIYPRQPAYETFFMPFLQVTKDPRLSFMIGSHYIQGIELRRRP